MHTYILIYIKRECIASFLKFSCKNQLNKKFCDLGEDTSKGINDLIYIQNLDGRL